METKINILILEHDPNDIELLQYQLKKSDFTFFSEVVQTREEYTSALQTFKPDIILSDYSLPAFDGLSAFKIRQEIAPETPFIIVSGTIGEENAVDLIKMGVTDYALKDRMYHILPKVQRALKEAADRKQKAYAEQQLKQREEHLQKIMDLSLDLIWALDQEGNFVSANRAAKLILDYLPEELIGKNIVDLVHDEDKERTQQAIKNLGFEIDIINFENRFIRKSGSVITLLWTARWDHQDKQAYSVAKDITSIRKAEEKIKQNEKRFRTLLQNSTEGLSLMNADGIIIERSPTALKILGLTAAEVSGKLRSDLVHPDDLPIINEACTRVKRNPLDIPTVEYRLLMPDGSYKWIETTVQNQLEEPAVEAIVLIFRDITARKHAEIELTKSEASLKKAQAIGHIGNFEEDLLEGVSVWSDEMYNMLGIQKEEAVPSFDLFTSFIHPEDRSQVLAELKEANASGQNGSITFRILRPDGEVRHVSHEWHFEYDTTGLITRVFGIQQDITDRKLAELAIQESEEKYRNLFNLSPTPMWVYDTRTLCFLDANEAAIKAYGYSKEEFLAMTLKDIRLEEDMAELEKVLDEAVKAGGFYQFVTRHVKKNGEVIFVDVQGNSIDQDKNGLRIILATDISERLNYIKAVEEQNAKLREISWIQSHVVRAPLARMMGLINLLDNSTFSGQVNKEDVLGYLATSAHELDRIIRDIVVKSEQVESYKVVENQL